MQRNRIKNLVRPSNRKPNGVYWHDGETLRHVYMKMRICYWLKQQGYEFMTEAIFEDGSRADVLCLDSGTIYEVCDSEEMTSLIQKKKKYPLPVIPVQASEPFNEKSLL